jgi:hypothetical protein
VFYISKISKWSIYQLKRASYFMFPSTQYYNTRYSPYTGTGWVRPAASYYNRPTSVATTTPINTLTVTDADIAESLRLLGGLTFREQDKLVLKSMGITPLFNNGIEILEVIRQQGAKIEYGDVGDDKTHAVWQKETNTILINQNYKGKMTLPMKYAVAASIAHEAGHASRLGDNRSSMQEEANCLGLNILAWSAARYADPQLNRALQLEDSRLVTDGVELYRRLALDDRDPNKMALVDRILEKYGTLAPESADHPIPPTYYGQEPIIKVALYRKQNNEALWREQQIANFK